MNRYIVEIAWGTEETTIDYAMASSSEEAMDQQDDWMRSQGGAYSSARAVSAWLDQEQP